ncbi:hypothetical protein E2C01_012482 [Portunus trituberculatus]|uniref:Uncharacterized protein n=1 Tax=Portunus trituberculatus TaxID=210409 RepID=A0A5B7DEU0_PORTR|nr:hypothetical protein [Portunus trituberculatus]
MEDDAYSNNRQNHLQNSSPEVVYCVVLSPAHSYLIVNLCAMPNNEAIQLTRIQCKGSTHCQPEHCKPTQPASPPHWSTTAT